MNLKSLNSKLTLGGILVVLIPLLVVGVFSAVKSSKALMSGAKEQANQIAMDLSNMAQLVLQEEIKLVSTLSVKDVVTGTTAKVKADGAGSSTAEIEKMSADLVAVMKKIGKDYETIIVADTNGIIFGDGVGGSYKGISIAERDYFKDAKSGKANVGTIVKSKGTGNPIVPIASPVYSSTGDLAGVIAIVMKIDFLGEKISSIKIGRTGYPWMVDKTGLIIAHPKKEFILELNLATQEGMKDFMAKMLSTKEGVDEYVFKGVHKICGFSTIELTGWKIGVTQDSVEFLEEANTIRNFILIIGCVFLIITITSVLFFARRISKPINHIVRDLDNAAQQISTASTEVSTASQSLAEGASEQAAAIEETSSSLEEMSSMTRQNAENAVHANNMMAEAKQIISRANASMHSLTKSMDEIMTASEETSKIIKTIDEIAFQTNLLALNAAVEAARAGEAGAGFAVVADEVRNLAIRAADAAKNTAGLIEGTVRKVKEGTELVARTNKDFAEVAGSAGKVAELVSEISAACTEQSEGIGQVNKAVVEMDKVVQNNAANAEELASASEETNAQAETMKGQVRMLSTIITGHDAGDGARNPNLVLIEEKARPAKGKKQKKLPFFRRGHEVKAPGGRTGRHLKPDEVIPLDDKEFRDF